MGDRPIPRAAGPNWVPEDTPIEDYERQALEEVLDRDGVALDRKLGEYVKKQLPVYQAQLEGAIKIRSESADSEHRQNLQRILDYMNGILTSYGFSVTTVPNHGFPVLVAKHASGNPNAKKLLIYNHMDVQPPGDLTAWTDLDKYGMKDPFDAKTKEGITKGRGATDDKGPALCIAHALNFLRTHEYTIPDVTWVLETQEEDGSKTFPRFMAEHGDLVGKPDVLLVSDTTFEGHLPAVSYGLRGLVDGDITLVDTNKSNKRNLVEVLDYKGGVEDFNKFSTIIPANGLVKLRVESSVKDDFLTYVRAQNLPIEIREEGDSLELKLEMGSSNVHSGIFGGIAVNPLTKLAYIVGSYLESKKADTDEMNALTKFSVLVTRTLENAVADKPQRIAVPGFYDGVEEVSAVEMDSIRQLAAEVDLTKDLDANGIKVVYTNDGVDQRVYSWTKPTFEVHGFSSKTEDGKTQRRMKVSFRLVDQQDPAAIAESYAKLAKSVDNTVEIQLEGTKAFKTDPNNPYVTLAREAYKSAFGTKAVLNRCGGTIGTMVVLQEAFPGLPVVLAGLSLLSDGYHKPNEEFRLEQASNGIETMARLIRSYEKME
ncbi:M20/M25/M40 family metallo-hydrolase [Candidatus Woesearchaeota archaeon]|nr:M20/M25/M40 family metallo-hydrolase [Candidatus Woesearchaeota archaeon]